MERAERDYLDALRELESSNVRANDEQEKLYAQLEGAIRQAKGGRGDVEEAVAERDALKLEMHLATERWAAERRELVEGMEGLRKALDVAQVKQREEERLLRARLADTSTQLSRSIAREEERLEELSRVRIEAGVARQRADAGEKRILMLQDQVQGAMRRQHVTGPK